MYFLSWLHYLATAMLSILPGFHGANDNSREYCSDSKCTSAGQEIILSLNRSVEPCTDFYEHACGGWKARNPVVPPHIVKSQFSHLTVKIHSEIAELFNNTQSSDMEALRKSKQFYDACMDLDAIERRGLEPIEKLLTENGEWPLSVPVNKWNPQNLSWQYMHENFATRVGVSALCTLTVDVDRSNSGINILSLHVPTVPSGRKRLLTRMIRDTKKADYKDYVIKAAKIIRKSKGDEVSDADLLADVEAMCAFEDEVDKLTILPEQNDNENGADYRVTTIATVQKDYDDNIRNNSVYSVDWLENINYRLQGTGIVVNSTEKIALKPWAVSADLGRLLAKTPVRTIVNFIHWKTINYLLPFTNTTIKNPVALVKYADDRSGTCINDHKMNHAVSYMYVKQHFTKDSRKAALEIVEHVQDEMKQEISQCSWLDEATKSVAAEKIDAMKNCIGYPEWYDDPSKINDYYNNLTVGPDYCDNVLVSNKFEEKKKLMTLRNPVSKNESDWIVQPYVVNAGYDPQTNSLNFPAAILQSPWFVYERSSVLNYGAIGAVVGHEISHGFDTTGRLYDKDGNKRKWWTQSTIDTYKIKAQCFIDQYDNYVISEDSANNKVHVNGTKTQGENIADTTGFRSAFKDYQRAKNESKTNSVMIESLKEFTDEQLYFYGLANTFCESVSDRGFVAYGSAVHCPARLRVIGSISNMNEFADAFNCPAGSPMNPSKKCLIWD